MEGYKTTIGLEIHAQLKTRTKMFCDSKNDADEKRPNVNICPVCMGYPGTLPVINKEAVKHVIRVGMAIGGEIADYTEFDRKNYFYPDIPKGYQISQYKHPLVKGGSINGIKITRIHLEEDTARSTHEEGDFSLVDFNRAGVPLMELVTEPVINSAEEASSFAKELQLLLECLGASDANMEKGEMRVEANISVSKTDDFGTKVEVKNLNSFKAVEKAIAFEIERHIALIENGENVSQETRGWDEFKQKTFSQRKKEDSHDYRYFPDPDLPKLIISKIPDLNPNLLGKGMPELPWERRKRYLEIGIKAEDADMFVSNKLYGNFFDEVVSNLKNNPKEVLLSSNYISSDIAGFAKTSNGKGIFFEEEGNKIFAKNFSELIRMLSHGDISSRGAKDILRIMLEKGGEPKQIAEDNDLIQKSDEGELQKVAEEIVNSNPNVVAEYKAGKTSVLQFFVGQGMKATKGAGNPEVFKTIFEKLLS